MRLFYAFLSSVVLGTAVSLVTGRTVMGILANVGIYSALLALMPKGK